MKTIISLLGILILTSATSIPTMRRNKSSDCTPEKYTSGCVSSIPKGFNLLKTYMLNGQDKEKIEFSYVFTRGTKYELKVCQAESASIKVDIFNADRKKIASSEYGDINLQTINYECAATGIYYISYTFPNKSTTCGLGYLCFSRK